MFSKSTVNKTKTLTPIHVLLTSEYLQLSPSRLGPQLQLKQQTSLLTFLLVGYISQPTQMSVIRLAICVSHSVLSFL